MSVWPWSDLVSYVMRYVNTRQSKFKVLELGCGAGANIPFFLSLSTEYYGVDGSQTIIKKLKKKFPNIEKNLVLGDFTKTIPFKHNFNLIVDRSSITHNSTKGIKNCLNMVYDKLKPNGFFIGIDWFSTEHFEYKNGCKYVDKFTRNGYRSGKFKQVGKVHFSNKKHLQELLNKFKIIKLEHKIIKTEIPNSKEKFASWNIVAKRIT